MALAFINCAGHYVNVDAIESYNEVTHGVGDNAKTWTEVRTRSGEVRRYLATLDVFEQLLLTISGDID